MATTDQASAPMEPMNESGNERHSYSIFILVLTVLSLVIMGLLLLPLSDATLDVLRFYDNLICVIFLIDFGVNLATTRPRRDYLITRRGWLDLLGSIPSLGFFPAAGLFRLARISRLARLTRVLGGDNRRALIRDVVTNRGEYALFVTVFSAFLVLVVSSVLMTQVESGSPDSNITTGGDALWWAFVTITTVGYGDSYPVTAMGRTVAVIVMFAGVGIIGSLASILASVLVPQPEPSQPAAYPASAGATVSDELASIRSELAALRQALENGDR